MKKKLLMRLGFVTMWTLSMLFQVSPLSANQYAYNGSAVWQNDMDKMILSVDFVNEPFKNVVEEIERKTGFHFTYNDQIETKRVTLEVKKESLEKVLQKLGQEYGFRFKQINKTVHVMVPQEVDNTDQVFKDVSGKVIDITGEPLLGVSILVKGTTTGTVTDLDGSFSLTGIDENAVLQFSFIGFKSKEVSVSGLSELEVVLEEDAQGLEEVVVTGYTSQKRENLTGSIAVVDGDKLKDITSPNVGNMLQGKMAGVDIVTSSGTPGALPTIRIRGKNSIRSSVDPIWVVDGVIWHGTPNLNPSDVESISVLKDAASAALYGSRGANGVVVVTTKSAKGADVSSFNLSAKTGVSLFNTGGFKISNSQEMYDLWGQFPNQNAVPDYYTEDLLNTDTDWLDVGTQAGTVQDYNLSYSGTSGKARIYTTGNYFKEEGSVKGYTYERLSGRFNVDYDVSEKFTFKPKLAATYTTTENRQHSIYDMYRNLPWDNPYDEAGNVVNPQSGDVTWYGRDNRNYLYDLQWNYSDNATFNILANMDFQYDITDNLSFISTNNITYYNSEGFSYTDPRSNGGLADNGRISNSMAKRITRFTNQMLSYTKSFDDHFINALVAYEYSDYVYNDLSATGKGIVPGATIISSTSEPTTIGGTKNDYAFQSYLLNANYGFKSKYNAQISFRRDGASRFGENKKYGNFFAISGSWNIHRESFFSSKAFSYLRLKAAYGGVGNTPSSLYPQYELYSLDAQYNGDPAAIPTTLGNDNLTWEKTYDSNIGVEFGLWNRLDGVLEVYNKSTSGLLHFVPLPNISGYDGYYDNIGGVRNSGIEFTLGADVLQTASGFNWRLDFNIGKNINEITELYEGRSQVSGQTIIEEGENIDTWYMRKWAGVNPEDGTPQWETVDPSTGEVSITGSYSAASLQKVGTSTPDFFGGLSSYMQFKNFYLNATMAYSHGAMVYHSARELFDSDGAYPTYNFMQLQDGWSRWTPENPNATHPQPIYGGNNNAHKASSRYLEDASFIRMRNVTLGYTIPTHITNAWKINGLSAYISADNLFTITDYSGLDPEAAVNGDNSSPYPLPRRISFGVNLSF
ncbi:SusC/RagA family TonB-linked outer membrane protein [Echinicola sp. 20G]|uniref:SusC/RagA family TonB-linked outer membrane protein n=1 Tax=Echinicola sp. 20G TaxID=2781961 RepID=UPI0019105142|nr:SusC/RagA family TonB-linked outer membrane protein [Echinicola sp. 20G]